MYKSQTNQLISFRLRCFLDKVFFPVQLLTQRHLITGPKREAALTRAANNLPGVRQQNFRKQDSNRTTSHQQVHFTLFQTSVTMLILFVGEGAVWKWGKSPMFQISLLCYCFQDEDSNGFETSELQPTSTRCNPPTDQYQVGSDMV